MIGIYKITNLLNGNVYIGKSVNISRRWREHRSVSKLSHTRLGNEIAHYKIENFSFEVLEECSISELNEKEAFYIAKFDSYKNGLNLTPGGEGGQITKRSVSDEEIDDIILLLKEDELPLVEIADLYEVSPGVISHINIGHSFRRESIEYPIRKQFSENQRKRYSETMRNKPQEEKEIIRWKKQITHLRNGTGSAVVDLSDKSIYPSANIAAEKLGGKFGRSIIAQIKGRQKTAFGKEWRYATPEETEALIVALEEEIC